MIVLALCGYDVLRGERDLELLRTYPGFDTLPAARENGSMWSMQTPSSA